MSLRRTSKSTVQGNRKLFDYPSDSDGNDIQAKCEQKPFALCSELQALPQGALPCDGDVVRVMVIGNFVIQIHRFGIIHQDRNEDQ